MKKIIIPFFVLMLGLFFVLESNADTSPSIRMKSSRTRMVKGDTVTISGRVIPKKAGVAVNILRSQNDPSDGYKIIKTVATDKYGKYSADIILMKTRRIRTFYKYSGKKIYSIRRKVVINNKVLIVPGYENAKEALSTGTILVNKTGDWDYTGNPEDNSFPYPIDFIDIKDIYLGIDEDNLYVLTVFDGIWPENNSDWPSFDGDHVTSYSFSIAIDSDNNPDTGCLSDGGVEMTLDIGATKNVETGTYNHYRTNPTGIEFPEEDRYENFYFFDGKIIGGPGYDYFINIYPLSNLNLTKGQAVSLKIKSEAESKAYSHASADDINWYDGPGVNNIFVTLGKNETINID
ncbi:MAG: hypothetical protein WC752_01935 [Patescibacteria group bacterium]|jgi:hypothetical protein